MEFRKSKSWTLIENFYLLNRFSIIADYFAILYETHVKYLELYIQDIAKKRIIQKIKNPKYQIMQWVKNVQAEEILVYKETNTKLNYSNKTDFFNTKTDLK